MLKTTALTLLALLAFAGNSVLCRLALSDSAIDAASFTSIRLLSGAIFLLVLVALQSRRFIDLQSGSWPSALLLFVYAIGFSYAYTSLDTGTGALILFGSVQATMIMYGISRGNKLNSLEWIGLILAFSGLLVLLLPGASAPSLDGFVLMTIAGIAWGFYTLFGKGSTSPLVDTANNFLRTLPLIALVTLVTFSSAEATPKGVLLAVASGALASGLGYAIWYSALASLTVMRAAILQLSVPIIAAIGGILFANEAVTLGVAISSVLVLGGIAIVILGKGKKQKTD